MSREFLHAHQVPETWPPRNREVAFERTRWIDMLAVFQIAQGWSFAPMLYCGRYMPGGIYAAFGKLRLVYPSEERISPERRAIRTLSVKPSLPLDDSTRALEHLRVHQLRLRHEIRFAGEDINRYGDALVGDQPLAVGAFEDVRNQHR